MKKYIYIIIALLGFAALFSSCEKDGDTLVLDESAVAPTLKVPDLKYTRANSHDILTFKGTPVNPGYKVSAIYFLEACAQGNDFVDVIEFYTGSTCDEIKLAVADINTKILKNFPEEKASAVDFRLRATLVADAGIGNKPLEYVSKVQTASITPFGLMRLDLIGSGMQQKIVSAAGDGKYKGFVKLSPSQAFTLKDPETGKSYGDNAGELAENGTAIKVGEAGWYQLKVDTKGLTLSPEKYFIGCVGSAVLPNGWDSPDQKMNYDPATDTWRINLDLVVGALKFRLNDGWAWNMGFADGEENIMKNGVMKGKLKQGGVGNDIPISEAGNYDIIFTILSDEAGTYEIIKKK